MRKLGRAVTFLELFDWIKNTGLIETPGMTMGEIFRLLWNIFSRWRAFYTINEMLITKPHVFYFVNTVIAPE